MGPYGSENSKLYSSTNRLRLFCFVCFFCLFVFLQTSADVLSPLSSLFSSIRYDTIHYWDKQGFNQLQVHVHISYKYSTVSTYINKKDRWDSGKPRHPQIPHVVSKFPVIVTLHTYNIHRTLLGHWGCY